MVATLRTRLERRGLARSLEQLLAGAEDARRYRLSAVVPPCAEQVRAATPEILRVIARLRSERPVNVRGVAQLRGLLADGTGPCYAAGHDDALRRALETVCDMLDIME